MVKELKILGRQLFSWGEPNVASKIERSMPGTMGGVSGYKAAAVSPVVFRKLASREPLFMKGATKKNMDLVRNWFTIKTVKDNVTAPDNILKIIYDYDKSVRFPYKIYTAGVCGDIYGTGFIERTFDEAANIKADSPPSPKAKPIGLLPKNSEFITLRKIHPVKKDKILYYIYKEKGGEEVFIHPDRLIDYATIRLPHSPFGISKVEILMNIMNSKMTSDQASGEIMDWFGTGLVDWTIQNMNDEEQDNMINVLKEHNKYLVHSERYTMDIKNPTRIDPKPFYEYFYTNTAAVFNMPTYMLIGGQSGNVTGSDVAFADYIQDISNIQNIILTPLIERVYKQLLESHGLPWKYKIVWNPIFTDELSEAKILQTRSYSATQNVNAGIVSISEGREILNNGVVDLDVNKIPEKPKPPEQPITDPNIEPQPVVKKPTIKNIIILTFFTAEKPMR